MTPIPKSDKPIRMVVCAANRIELAPGAYHIICSARHFDPLMHSQIDACVNAGDSRAEWRGSEQGFVDQWGVFMDRKEAMVVAKAAGQVRRTEGLPTEWLDSSHLY